MSANARKSSSECANETILSNGQRVVIQSELCESNGGFGAKIFNALENGLESFDDFF